jgi:hypothetical protein
MADFEKIWFILVDGKPKGPYSFYELRANQRITPDTLGWREGLSEWRPLREIPELQRLFDEGTALHETEEVVGEKKGKKGKEESELVVVARQEPPYWTIWVILILLLAIWIFFSIFSRT